MRLWVGTSGYSYKEWKGHFYPEKISPDHMLAYYAERLPAVEINNTFYRLPRSSVLESWAGQVPASFRFAIKASRRITHLKRLKDVVEETSYLLDTLRTLGERLGCILFQTPPNLKKDFDRLRTFLDLLPQDTRAAFEFRHESWLDEEVRGALRERDCALCTADVGDDDLDDEETGEEAAAEAPAGEAICDLASTASWGYLRLRRPGYADAELALWRDRVAATGWSDAFIFFKHEDEAAGPKMAARLLELAGER